ncbi:MAG: biopolymer transporter ExbD [Planctomycetota bacterium]
MTPRRSHVTGFDLTPMIDVVLLLIIFFLVSAQISRSIRQPLDLPNQAGTPESEVSTDGVLVVDLLRGGDLRVDNETVSLETFSAMLNAAGGTDQVVLVRPEHDATASHLNRLTRLLTDEGATRYRIATDPSGRGGG